MRLRFSTPKWIILVFLLVVNCIVLSTIAHIYLRGSHDQESTTGLLISNDRKTPMAGTEGVSNAEVNSNNEFQSTLTSNGLTQSPELSKAITDQPSDAPLQTSVPQEQRWVEEMLGKMSLEEKIGQLMIISLDDRQKELSDCILIQQVKPGGMFLHPQNVGGFEQLRTLTTKFQTCAEESGIAPLLVSIDHEGEYVQRFDNDATLFPAALGMGAANDLNLLYEVSLAAGQELAYSGINVVFGPVADLLANYDNKVVSQRTYGGDPERVSQFVRQAVKGYSDGGVIPTLKHFPGHGSVSADSHKTLPIDNTDREDLHLAHLPPFIAGIDSEAPIVMLSHVAYPEISGEIIPASLSPEIVTLLREDLGFDGVILTDALGMKAVSGGTYRIPQASIDALNAGVDLLLITGPNKATSTHQKLISAVNNNEIPIETIDHSVKRILSLKEQNGLTEYPKVKSDHPDLEEHKELAVYAGNKAVTLFKDSDNLIPLPGDIERLLIIGPVVPDWFFYNNLEEALLDNNIPHDKVFFPPPWEGEIIDSTLQHTILQSLDSYDLILAITWQSHINSLILDDYWQIDMINGLVDSGLPLIVVAMKSPTDIIDFPEVDAYLGTYGTNKGALNYFIDILFGKAEPSGVNPLPDLPLE